MSIVAPLPKGLHHLEVTVPHKFSARFSPRVMHQKKFVQPKDRVVRWNIRQGDFVRLNTGKPEDKWINGKDATAGWKVHQVSGIDMERNTLRLSGVTAKKTNPVLRQIPANADETRRREFENQRNFLNISRPVHYSNVSLCIEQGSEKDGASAFANRIATSRPVWDKRIRAYRNKRFAAGPLIASDPEKWERDEQRHQVVIPWPALSSVEPATPLKEDTLTETVAKKTLTLSPISSIWTDPALVPLATSSRAPTHNLARKISDEYMTTLKSDSPAPTQVDTLMPLYLSDELSPRFSRAKATKSWNLNRAAEALEKSKYAQKVVADWKLAGKDSDLASTLAVSGLEGVHVRPRLAREVRASAESDYTNAVFERGRIARLAKRAGGTFDVVNDVWKVELDPAELKRKQKKAERTRRKEAFLRLNRL